MANGKAIQKKTRESEGQTNKNPAQSINLHTAWMRRACELKNTFPFHKFFFSFFFLQGHYLYSVWR